jgi:hypothetical protein
MKRILLSLLCIAVPGIFNVFAQSKVYFVAKAGYNLSKITFFDTDFKGGLNLGLGMDWQISKKFGLETGLYYSEYGAKNLINKRIDNVIVNHELNIMHLQIPIMAKYYIYKGLNVFAGPQAGYELDISMKPVWVYAIRGEEFNFSGIAGIGYQFNFGLSVSANYVHSFTDLDPSYETYGILSSESGETIIPEIYKSNNIRTRAFQFNIGWRF